MTGDLDPSVEGLRIKTSGCFNSCGQHHIADLGFYGVSRTINGYSVPHFQVVLGGKWVENAGEYGLAIGAVPSKRVPEALERISDRFVAERQADETFQKFVARVGKMAAMHDGNAKALRGGFQHQRAGIHMINRCGLQVRQADLAAPGVECAGHLAMNEHRLSGEVVRLLTKVEGEGTASLSASSSSEW
mgnify:CR=1 FL=1